MTNHAELSRELALALGYYPESVLIDGTLCYVYRTHRPDIPQMLNWQEERWYSFDYRDPTVCLPLIKWLMVEHWAMVWYSPCRICLMIPMDDHDGPIDVCADTLEKAVARAVIALKGKP